jgi:hypothetical protein
MFNKTIDERLSLWANHRRSLEVSDTPLEDAWEFWKLAPYVQYNNLLDPHYHQSWPSPWEIIVHNKYDDFTRAVMIGMTLKLTNRYKDSQIKIETYLDKTKTSVYNIVNIDDIWLINYNDIGLVKFENLSEDFYLENIIKLEPPR